MPPTDYDLFRQQLEKQLRADIELLYEAYRAKLRAYETVWRARGELGMEPAWAPPLALPLEPAAERLPAAAPEAAASPPVAPPRPKAPPLSLYHDCLRVLDQLGETFDKNDLLAALGYVPHRATLYRTLRDLQMENFLEVAEIGVGGNRTRYRRLAPGSRFVSGG